MQIFRVTSSLFVILSFVLHIRVHYSMLYISHRSHADTDISRISAEETYKLSVSQVTRSLARHQTFHINNACRSSGFRWPSP